MGYGEKRGGYYRGRYKISDGKYGTVADPTGATIKFRTKREAKQAADAEEVKVRSGRWRDQRTVPTFGEYANDWYASQELAPSTMENYADHIQGHLLPYFSDVLLTSIQRSDIAAWEKQQKASSYAATSVQTYRSILHLILGDALEEGLIDSNPATTKRNRGRRAGRSRTRGPEKAVTDPLGALLIAERAALLSGRDDEFVQTISIAYTGMRWGESVGLEKIYVRPRSIRIEWQLYELNSGSLVRCPPKDDSHRTLDAPAFLSDLLRDHIDRTQPVPCDCHGERYVFRAAALKQELRVPRAVIAREAGVAPATVSRTLNRPETVTAPTQARVHDALARFGVVSEPTGGQLVPHWTREGFRHQIFAPSASGWYPSKGDSNPAHPVCLRADPWPGQVVRGRWSAAQAEACWAPIEAALTPHGMRHCHRTWMEDLGTRKVLMDERMGHVDSSVSARYAHVTQGMRDRLIQGLTGMWEGSLAARAAMSPRSPVAALDRLLAKHQADAFSQNSPKRIISQTLERLNIPRDLHTSRSSEPFAASYFMKSPPVQYFDDQARENVEKFIAGELEG